MHNQNFSREREFTIANGQSLSGVVRMEGSAPKYIAPLAGVEGTYLSFYRVIKGVDYQCQGEDGALITVQIAAGECTELNAALFAGGLSFRVQTCSAADGTPQVQTGAATIIVGTI